MGCDIHAYVEVRENKDQKWKLLEEIDIGRSYDSFSLLCGVRNYYRPIPIAVKKVVSESTSVVEPGKQKPAHYESRELPDDLSEEIRDEYGEGINWHSPGFVTPDDLLSYQYWDTPFADTRAPKGTNPRGTKSGGIDSFDEIRQPVKLEDYERMTPREAIEQSQMKTVFNDLLELGKKYRNSNVRMVFWFDN
jgi:hypothetical protein